MPADNQPLYEKIFIVSFIAMVLIVIVTSIVRVIFGEGSFSRFKLLITNWKILSTLVDAILTISLISIYLQIYRSQSREVDILENQNKILSSREKTKLTVHSWGIETRSERVPLIQNYGASQTQEVIVIEMENITNKNAYNIEFCLYAEEISQQNPLNPFSFKEKIEQSSPTTDLRRRGQPVDQSWKNFLKPQESDVFEANTFLNLSGSQTHAFEAIFGNINVNIENIALGGLIVFDDEHGNKETELLFIYVGEVGAGSIQEFISNAKPAPTKRGGLISPKIPWSNSKYR